MRQAFIEALAGTDRRVAGTTGINKPSGEAAFELLRYSGSSTVSDLADFGCEMHNEIKSRTYAAAVRRLKGEVECAVAGATDMENDPLDSLMVTHEHHIVPLKVCALPVQNVPALQAIQDERIPVIRAPRFSTRPVPP